MFSFVNMPAIAPAAGGGDFFGGIFPMLVIFVIFYLFLIVPQQKKAKEHQKLLNALKRGDKVLLTGGIYGSVSNVKGDIVEVKIAEGVTVEAAKSAVSAVIVPPAPASSTPDIVK
ncbi:MAG: preprotein translocase subunit YajC [Elusimicrobia bacterium HGW-Elusimicrobia-1]|nr:MAG: preprotein translocase subunit YajC [Elusimicrobia bacterium HGW-Elusimicrobia-1]